MAVIVDIDGTILRSGIYPIRKMIDWVNSQDTVYIVTARPEAARESTTKALKNAGVQYNRLLMNNVGRSHAEGLESKRRHGRSLKGSVSMAVDNDADARAAYESVGIKAVAPSAVTKYNWDGTFTEFYWHK